VAYIISEYPKVSHTFVMREVDALRRRGVLVDTVSIRRTPEGGLLSAEDRRAAAETFAVLPVSPKRLVSAHAARLARAPTRYLQALATAFRAGPAGSRNRLWQLFYFAEAGVLADELGHRGTDHLHAHFVNVACSVTMLAAEMLGKPFSFTMHGPLEFDNVELHGIVPKTQRAAFVACISDFCRAQMMRLVDPRLWPRLHVIHCGIDPAEPVVNGERSATERRPVEIVSVGRLAPMKGFAVLIDAVSRLVAMGADVHLTVIGDGPDRPSLEARAASELPVGVATFTGALEPAGVAAHLRRADVFCLASFAEGVPVVLMEAMAAALPVVATAIMGIPELVAPEAGTLVPPGRSDLLADALLAFVDDPELRVRAGVAGRAVVRDLFDVNTSADQLADLYRSSR
jgi:glycosyltransferase involved in cell wall biosynthesis